MSSKTAKRRRSFEERKAKRAATAAALVEPWKCKHGEEWQGNTPIGLCGCIR